MSSLKRRVKRASNEKYITGHRKRALTRLAIKTIRERRLAAGLDNKSGAVTTEASGDGA